MPDDELRPEVVAALSEPRHLPAELVDQVLDATPAEQAAAAGQLLDDTRAFLEQAGVLPRTKSVLDLDLRSLSALAAAYMTVADWWQQPAAQALSLGDVLKTVPAERARWVVRVLVWAGLLPPEPAGPQE